MDGDERCQILTRAYRERGRRLARRIAAITGDPATVNETFIRAHVACGLARSRRADAGAERELAAVVVDVVAAQLVRDAFELAQVNKGGTVCSRLST
ncbi:hypothetical protein ENSA7_15180 [Enhygromyxa salina]|uniref:Uncharacterized protein n=2 Tax=Enhygromyxa salina TaxID=215803 RepID=A0A2S9YUW9_9BACT|nr:hypothetical protein ENSA7_15180 [Enhygromyxa salina]